ncbi:hypothetical protein EDWATA_04034, partial [Edwardsiella tarda ATCC 23685]
TQARGEIDGVGIVWQPVVAAEGDQRQQGDEQQGQTHRAAGRAVKIHAGAPS